jgi:hypothetical protein
MITFAGFPLGGLTAEILIGRVDTPGAARLGGLLTGAVLGAVQGWALHGAWRDRLGWAAATAFGLMAGLGLGSAPVGYRTGLTELLVQGAICGTSVGLAQSALLRPALGRLALVWPPLLGAIWAAGWAVTTAAGVRVDQQFTVFGSTGALVVTALTAVLPLTLHRARILRSAIHPYQESPS